MKFLTVFFALCLMAVPLEAQRGGGGGHGGGGGGFHGGGGGGFHGGGGGFHGGGGFRGGGAGMHAGGMRGGAMGGFHGNNAVIRGGGMRGGSVSGFHGGVMRSGAVGGFHGNTVGGFHGNTFRGNAFHGDFRNGFHDRFDRFHGGFFGSSFVFAPFFGFGWGGWPYYYPEPIYTAPVYAAPGYVSPAYDAGTVYDLSGQAGAVAPAQPQPTTVIVVMKDGRRIESPGFALVGTKLWILDSENATKVSINDVDVAATQQVNRDRGIDIVIPSR
jgi:hypothetical protein